MNRKLKLSMLGAGSGFVKSIAKEFDKYSVFENAEFVKMDINENSLDIAYNEITKNELAKNKHNVKSIMILKSNSSMN